MAMLEKRKAALAAEGLFDAARKRALPFLPEVIGVVTSPSGAVIRDILHRLRDRFPRRVLVWPVTVQGERCAAEVAAAIRGFNALPEGGPVPRPDVLIVARGGGSLEDLWGFNEEIVVRAAAESAIPLISAVGHETDTTLIDFAADRRAPTPTAAAEMAVPVRLDLLAAVAGLEERRRGALARGLGQRSSGCATCRAACRGRRRWGAAGGAGGAACAGGRARLTAEKTARLAALSGMLKTLDYHAVLARGYAVVRGGAGQVVTRAQRRLGGGAAGDRVRRRAGRRPAGAQGRRKRRVGRAGAGQPVLRVRTRRGGRRRRAAGRRSCRGR
jgi:exodeoxyribonuclease VII large subunit